MAFFRPTLAELAERIQQDFVSRLALRTPILRRSMVYILSRVVAGAAHMLHGHMEYLAKQIFPDQSDGEFLLRQAQLFGLELKPAAFASGDVLVYGTAATVVPAGSLLVRPSDGAEYATQADVTIAANGMATVVATALAAGAEGNCDPGLELSFESPIAGVLTTATVTGAGIGGGADEETLEALRGRLMKRFREPPQGGSADDYVAWATEVPGVSRAWTFPLELGPGTVVVRFVRDEDVSIIPDATEVAAVKAYIDERRPVTAQVTVQAPVPVSMNYSLSITPDTPAIRAAVESELMDLLRRVARPGGTILRSQVDVAIGTTDGVTDFEIFSPAGDTAHAPSQMAVHGAMTWV